MGLRSWSFIYLGNLYDKTISATSDLTKADIGSEE